MAVAVSSRWYPTLANSHSVGVRFEVFTSGLTTMLYQSPVIINGTQLHPVPGPTSPQPAITAGKVTYSKTAAVRSQLSMTLVDPTGFLVPKTNSDVLTPWGHEIRVYRGLVYPDGSYELPRLGTFRITDVVTKDDKGAPVVTVTGQDRSRIISRNKIVNYYQSGLGQAYSDLIRSMALLAYPGVRFNNTAANWYIVPPAGIGVNGARMVYTDSIVPLIYQEGQDPWVTIRDLAHALSCDLYFDRDGVLTLVMDPNLNFMSGVKALGAPPPVAQYVEGKTATFTTATKTLSDKDAVNQWIITGEGQVIGQTLNPMRSAPAADTDPNSPTYIKGVYGVVTGFETNTLMRNQGQVNQYAKWKLSTTIGAQESVMFDGFVDSRLDIDDGIQITRRRIGLSNDNFIIDGLMIPLEAKSAMQVTLRERRALV